MIRKICRGIDEVLAIEHRGQKKILCIYYLCNENMLGITSFTEGPAVIITPPESSMLACIELEVDKVVIREEWMLWWLEQATETCKL